ncbi:catechol 2,3-dioxygenase-like lactoylglutathione lyase family enzyme [Mycobacterium sp. MAA66]|uniref:VOC family protein n=1 Tax=Mycobacterium sp. MAA66 TaxID=3156297 RepID=UPI0035174086
MTENAKFKLGGVNHLALVCADMKRTVEFYSGTLGMPLIKTLDLPGGSGQHFFFDCGGGNCIAFFWFPTAPDGVPGVSGPCAIPGIGDIVSATGSMNHLAFHVPVEEFENYRERLKADGVEVSNIMDHDESPAGVAKHFYDGVFIRSFYFKGPDEELLEFACWTKAFTEADVQHEPRTAAERRVPSTISG